MMSSEFFIFYSFFKKCVFCQLIESVKVVILTVLFSSFFFFLFKKDLVPERCVRLYEWEEEYKEIWECNFLGLPLSVAIPLSVNPTTYALVDVVAPPMSENSPHHHCKLRFMSQVVHSFIQSIPVLLTLFI